MSATHLHRNYGYNCPGAAAAWRALDKLKAAALLEGKRSRDAARKLDGREPPPSSNRLSQITCKHCRKWINARPMIWNALRAAELSPADTVGAAS